MCKPSTLADIREILEKVVSEGLGKKAGQNLLFPVSGKTGTAQVADQYGGYHSGITRYWLSFAGYFPSDNPLYTCIVCIKKSGLPASGGGMSGVVFRHIAGGVMARHLKMDVKDAHNEESIVIPDVKNGDVAAANLILQSLDIKALNRWEGTGSTVWGTAERRSGDVALTKMSTYANVVPDVTGMGAKDAVYLLESRGLKVRLNGRGKVKKQSFPAGKPVLKGCECILTLE